MAIGKVIGGKYAGCTIHQDDDIGTLYVKLKTGKKSRLTARNIAKYRKRPDLAKPGVAAYAVQWVDGQRSVLYINKDWDDAFIESCETIPASPTKNITDSAELTSTHPQRLSSILLIAIIFFVITVLVVGFVNSLFPNGLAENNDSSYESHGTWAQWDRSSGAKKPEADVLMIPDQAAGFTEENWGLIGGTAYNNSNKTYQHLEVIYGLYYKDLNGERIKLTTCTFSVNDANFKPDEDFDFSAYCDKWTNDTVYVLESVGFN